MKKVGNKNVHAKKLYKRIELEIKSACNIFYFPLLIIKITAVYKLNPNMF